MRYDGAMLDGDYARTQDAWAISGYSAQREARGLLTLLQHGDTIEAILELIRVTPREETVLRAFAIEAPELAGAIERMLAYRISVEREFTRGLSRRADSKSQRMSAKAILSFAADGAGTVEPRAIFRPSLAPSLRPLQTRPGACRTDYTPTECLRPRQRRLPCLSLLDPRSGDRVSAYQ